MAKNISEIYKEYFVRKDIATHMLGVAAISKIVSENFTENINEHFLITISLLHDIGNILRKNTFFYPELSEPEGIEYWKNVADRFRVKYKHEDNAVMCIAKEVGLPSDLLAMLQMTLSKLEDFEGQGYWEVEICKYADTRINNIGKVVSIQERMEEWHKRNPYISSEIVNATTDLFKRTEERIFLKCKIRPEDITDESIAPIVSSLKDFVI